MSVQSSLKSHSKKVKHFHGSMKIKGNKWISVEIHNLQHSNVIVTVKNLIVFILLSFKRNWDIYFPFPRELFTLFYFGLQSHQKRVMHCTIGGV